MKNENWRIIVFIVVVLGLLIMDAFYWFKYIIKKNDYIKIEANIVEEYSYGHGRAHSEYAIVECSFNNEIIQGKVSRNFWEHTGDIIIIAIDSDGNIIRPSYNFQLLDIITIVICIIAIYYYIKK